MSNHEVPGVGRFSDAHGTSRANGQSRVFEAVPDGVRPAKALPADPHPKPNGQPFTPETAKAAAHARWAKHREQRTRPDFAERELEIVPFKDFEPFEDARKFAVTTKLDELRRMVGIDRTPGASLGAGVTAVVRGWAWMLSFAEFYATRAAQTGDPDDAERSRKFFKDASIELSKAHELTRAEATARPRDARAALNARILAAGKGKS